MTEGSVARPWATPEDVTDVWRSLSQAEEDRATVLIGYVERAIVREWPETLGRLENGTLGVDDVRDVVVVTVLNTLGIDVEIPMGAKAYQETSGSESRSVTLSGSLGDTFLSFAPWMVRVFEGGTGATRPAGPVPRYSAPAGGRFDTLGFLWPENGAQRAPGSEYGRER